MLLILAAVNASVLAVNYDTSFTVTAPLDARVTAAALWTVGKDPDNATMTDYRDEMIYWYYAGAFDAAPGQSAGELHRAQLRLSHIPAAMERHRSHRNQLLVPHSDAAKVLIRPPCERTIEA
jgi:hypothetical protein